MSEVHVVRLHLHHNGPLAIYFENLALCFRLQQLLAGKILMDSRRCEGQRYERRPQKLKHVPLLLGLRFAA